MTAGRVAGAALVLGLGIGAATAPAVAQSTLERPAGLPEVWAGIPWSLELAVRPLFGEAGAGGSGLSADPSIRAALALPRSLVAELRYAPQPVESGGRDEVEAGLRLVALRQDHGRPVDLALAGRFGTGSELAAAAATAARWVGPLRLLGTAHGLFSTGDADPRIALGAGAVLHPGPGRLPVALVADATTVLGAETDEGIAWHAGVQVGVGHTPHTLSLFATNAGNSIAGRVMDTGATRVGIELTTHIPVGRFFGLWVDRPTAQASVREAPAAVPVVTVRIADYRYSADRIVIPAGTAVEWINEDAVVHTATADDGAWNSGGLEQGQSWRAVFDEPGIFPYYCGPHPYMRGVVIVTGND